jgi:hypothetical protein
MIKTQVNLYKDGLLRAVRTINDTTAFVERIQSELFALGHMIDADQIINDIVEECAPVIEHPTNGQRFEFTIL